MSIEYALKVTLPNGSIAFGAIDESRNTWRLASVHEWQNVALFANLAQARDAAVELIDAIEDVDQVDIARFKDSIGRPFETISR